jgi:hypothetical protein
LGGLAAGGDWQRAVQLLIGSEAMTVDVTRFRGFSMWAWAGTLALLASLSMGQRAAIPAPPHDHSQMATAPADCEDTSFRCATSATPFIAPDGRLWLAWAASGFVSVASSSDLGRTFTHAVRVNSSAVHLDDGPDERPQIVVNRQGGVVVGFATFRNDEFDGEVFVAQSGDHGSTFTRPVQISNSEASQRFISLALDRDDAVFASWVDKRNVVAAKVAGRPFSGASLAFAWSTDGGKTFGAAQIAENETCECCRLGVALTAPGRPVLLFRNIFSGERDHAVVTFADRRTPGQLYRISDDHWKIDGCPHQGPSLALSPDGTYHATWFSGGGVREGLFYARSRDGGRTFSTPMPIGNPARHPSRPYVLATGSDLWLVWKESEGKRTTIEAINSPDEGMHWSAPRVVAETTDFSDHPLLVRHGTSAYLSWLTRNEGYRLLRLSQSQPKER